MGTFYPPHFEERLLTAPLNKGSLHSVLCFNGLIFLSCISDGTVRQFSAKDQLSKHYQVPVFKFIGKDNRVSRELVHTGKFSCLAYACAFVC